MAADEKTYQPIKTYNITSNTQVVEFTSIPNTYTDLVILFYGTGYSSGTALDNITVQFNSDTGTNYTYIVGSNENNTAVTNRSTTQSSIKAKIAAGPSANSQPSYAKIEVFNYTNTNAWKTVLINYGGAAGTNYEFVGMNSGVWRSTSAVTSIQLKTDAGAATGFVSGRFTLYGIKAA